jgi:hypothetical protein
MKTYSLADSPVGPAAWFDDKFAAWTYSDGHAERELARDKMLDDITLYGLTSTGTSSAQLCWESRHLHPCCRDSLFRRLRSCATKLGRTPARDLG